MDRQLILENKDWIPDMDGDFLVDFSNVVVLESIDEKILNIHDGTDTIKESYVLCKNKSDQRYELWLCHDYYAHGQWIKQYCAGKFPIGRSIAERILGYEKNLNLSNMKNVDIDLLEMIKKINKKDQSEAYYIDLEYDLRELACCMSNKAYRASLSLCGRILEVSLKILLYKNNIYFEKDWMVGKLLSVADANNIYCDPSLKNVLNLINQQRIIGVHAKERVPIPSKKQALMVLYAILDTLDRSIFDDIKD